MQTYNIVAYRIVGNESSSWPFQSKAFGDPIGRTWLKDNKNHRQIETINAGPIGPRRLRQADGQWWRRLRPPEDRLLRGDEQHCCSRLSPILLIITWGVPITFARCAPRRRAAVILQPPSSQGLAGDARAAQADSFWNLECRLPGAKLPL